MDSKNPAQPSLKQKATHELQEFVVISLYLALFFCALAAYTKLLLKDYNTSSSMSYGFAIINALVIGKVILMGEMVHFGRELDNRPLYQTALYKAFMFTLLVLAFHFVEEFVKRVIHGGGPGSVLYEICLNDLIARSLVVFCTFIPLFAFMDLRRMLGEDKFYGLFFRSRAARAIRTPQRGTDHCGSSPASAASLLLKDTYSLRGDPDPTMAKTEGNCSLTSPSQKVTIVSSGPLRSRQGI